MGLILSDARVIELPNHSSTPENGFEIHKHDIVLALGEYADLKEVTLWHSHPSGGIGPSRIDMQQKTVLPYHLVLAIVDGDLIPTWY